MVCGTCLKPHDTSTELRSGFAVLTKYPVFLQTQCESNSSSSEETQVSRRLEGGCSPKYFTQGLRVPS